MCDGPSWSLDLQPRVGGTRVHPLDEPDLLGKVVSQALIATFPHLDITDYTLGILAALPWGVAYSSAEMSIPDALPLRKSTLILVFQAALSPPLTVSWSARRRRRLFSWLQTRRKRRSPCHSWLLGARG